MSASSILTFVCLVSTLLAPVTSSQASESVDGTVWHWTLMAGLGYDKLDGGRSSWQQQFAAIRTENERGGEYSVRLERSVRFGATDGVASVAGEWRVSKHSFAGVEVSLADSATFLPRRSFSAHAGRDLGDGWVADLRYRYRRYAVSNVSMLSGTVEKYFGDFRAAYTLGIARPDGAPAAFSHVGHLNWYCNAANSLGITLSSGREVEAVGAGQVLETDVRALAVTGRHQLTGRLAINWWLGVHEQGDFYRRQSIGLAVAVGL